MTTSKASYFQSRTDLFLKEAATLNKKFKMLSTIRIVLFLLSFSLIIYYANERNAWAIFFIALPSIILFFLIVKIHNKIKYERNHAEFLAGINKNELKRLNSELKEFDGGLEFIDEEHYYSSDLDIFGKNSLFQLINRTESEPGRSIFASWLQSPADRSEILSRQEAVKELSDQVDWRQQFQASAMHSGNSSSEFSQFSIWLEEPSRIISSTFYRIISFLLPLITLASIAGVIFYSWAYQISVILLVINGIVLSRYLKLASETTEKAQQSLGSILAFSAMIRMIESKQFESNCLLDIKKAVITDNVIASQEINLLSRIMQKFDSRANALFFILDLILLLDIHWLIEAESWRKRNSKLVRGWIENIGKLEAISSLAGCMHTHEYPLPEISSDFYLKLTDSGHPLIRSSERVLNDFEMSQAGSNIIITGSNMSGKSTFLRTIGINQVMAFAGGPVCCREAIFPVMNIYTSMRTHDSLEEHISSFYAELKRIKGLLQLIEISPIPVFYLLDEILKGTNSEDRHLGAESLVIQLLSINGMGIISTHDLTLSSLENKFNKVSNYSFNSTILADEIKFDYKINKGICKGFNASKLMEKMGIKLQINNDRNQ